MEQWQNVFSAAILGSAIVLSSFIIASSINGHSSVIEAQSRDIAEAHALLCESVLELDATLEDDLTIAIQTADKRGRQTLFPVQIIGDLDVNGKVKVDGGVSTAVTGYLDIPGI